jgi:glyoxylase-like metal-dependent hydrolase (beta-lactamase superfamily II)
MTFDPLPEMDEAWRISPAGLRLEAVRAAARKLKARLHASGKAVSVRTYDTAFLPYPIRFGFGDAHRALMPYLFMTNRMQLVTFRSRDGNKRLLVNPSDAQRDRETPFFKQLASGVPEFVQRFLMRNWKNVPEHLASVGLRGEQVDYITFDHLHTQDVRRLMTEWCPNAKLIAHKDELAIFERLHPLQHQWYIPESLAGVPAERIVPFDRDLLLGEGVALVRTPGHTDGNHSIVLNTDRGLWSISENGVSLDNYCPERSQIGGLAAHARACGVEVILNANTRERTLDQYTSMILEKTLVDESSEGWPQVFNSSELTPSAFQPGLAPTFAHREITHGPAAG